MTSTEQLIVFGDVTGINSSDLRNFVETTHLYGGSYPSREEGLSDEEVARKTHEFLAEAGVLNPTPTTLCDSTEERARQILQNCRKGLTGANLCIIDTNPNSLAEAIISVREKLNLQPDILRTTTIIRLSSTHPFDYSYKDTGIRVVFLPTMSYRFPTHPTPAS